jgi:hypothetical protein
MNINQRIKFSRRILYVFLLLTFFGFDSLAQPTVFFTDATITAGSGYTLTNSRLALTDRGAFRQTIFSVGASSQTSKVWNFSIGTQSSPVVTDNWRPYSAGSTALTMDAIAAPNTTSPGFGALYNNNTGTNGNLPTLSATTSFVVNFLENGAADSYMAMWSSSFAPDTLLNKTHTAGTGSVSYSVAMSTNEYMYMRYTTNAFVSSTLMRMNPTGTNAFLPGFPSNSLSSSTYYFYTSSRTKAAIDADVTTYGQNAHALSSYYLVNNAGSNYTSSFSFPVSVAGTTDGNGTLYYVNMGCAFAAINNGVHTGVVSISVNGNTTEQVTCILNASGVAAGNGTASYTAVNITPNGGATRTISGSIASGHLLDINGADNVTIDGKNSGGDSLYIDNTSSSGSSAIKIQNTATRDTIKNCVVKAAPVGSTNGVIIFDQGATGTGSDNCAIMNNKITGSSGFQPSNGVMATGVGSGNTTDSVTISGNEIYDYFLSSADHGGVNLNGSTTANAWTISNNHFYQTASRALNSGIRAQAITITTTNGGGYIISGNYIGGRTMNAGGSAMTYTSGGAAGFIRISASTTAASSIQGNIIKNISFTTSSTSTSHCIVSLTSGKINFGTTSGNVIGESGTTNSIFISCSGTGAVISYILSGTGTVDSIVIANNSILGCSTVVSGATVPTVNGIFTQGTNGVFVIRDNFIGELFVNNSFTSSGNTAFRGIFSTATSSTGRHIISGNDIQGMSHTSSGTSAQLIAISVVPASGTAPYSVKYNIIHNLYSSTTNTGTGSSTGFIGISLNPTSSSNQDTVSGNNIYELYSTAGSANTGVIGLHFNGPTTATNVIEKNKIYSLSSVTTGTSAFIIGMNVAGGTSNFQNNMIQVGILPDGSDMDKVMSVTGISESGGTNNFYHNSVYVGGSVSGTMNNNTFAFNSSVTVNTRSVVNNIFYNARTNSSGSGRNIAYAISSTNPTGLTSDYNIFYAPNTNGFPCRAGSTNYTTLSLFRTAMAANTTPILNDLHSGVGDPNYVNPNAPSSGVDLHVQSNTPAEGQGNSSVSLTDDIDAQTRSSNTPVDIGADADTYTFGTGDDIYTPYITIPSPLATTVLTTNRIVTATITDQGNGVYLDTTGNAPRIWWRRVAPSTSAWYHEGGVLASGNSKNGTWNFTIDYAGHSFTPTGGDSIEYIIVAQDSITNNIWCSSFIGASFADARTLTTPPQPYTSYYIAISYSGNYNIGSGQTYTSLTASGATGIFNAINNGALTGNVTLTITSDITETGAIALNQWLESGVGNYTLTVQSDGTLRTLSSTALSNPMIQINGADRVTFNGTNKLLRFRNTHTTASSTTAVFQFTNTATSNTVSNCDIESNSASTTSGAVSIITSTTGNNTVTITNNKIHDATGGTTGRLNTGVFINSSTSRATVSNNNIYNINTSGGTTSAGIYLNASANGCTISGNSIYDTIGSHSGATWQGIAILAADSHVVSGNYIGGSQPLCASTAMGLTAASATMKGILISTATIVNPVWVLSNTVQNISITGGTSPVFNGIHVTAGKAMIGTTAGGGNTIGHPSSSSLGVSSTGGATVIGINEATAATLAVSISNNTISYLSTTSSGTTSNIRGISCSGSGTGTQTDTIFNNTVTNITYPGSNAGTTSSSAVLAIDVRKTVHTVLIDKNTVSVIRLTNTSSFATRVIGIYAGSSTLTDYNVKRNKVYGITNTSTNTGQFITGIFVNSGVTMTFTNNMVSLTNGSNTNLTNIYGIWESTGGTTTNLYYNNNIYIGGTTASGSQTSYAYYRNVNSSKTKLINNILFNERTGGTGGHYAVGASTTGAWSANYNLLAAADTTKVGEWSSAAKNFNNWKSSSSSDSNSWCTLNSEIIADSLFTDKSNGDLSIRNDRRACWYVNGKGLAGPYAGSINTDFTGDSRSTTYGFGTDIGADEFSTTTQAPACKVTGNYANGDSVIYTFAQRRIAKLQWAATNPPTSVSVYYYSGTTPPDNTNNGGNPSASYMNWYTQMIATGGSGYEYNATINYDDALLGGVSTEGNLKMAKSPDNGVGAWKSHSGSTVNTTANTIFLAALNSFSIFTGNDGSTPLAVKLYQWAGQVQANNHILLNWATANELNLDHFNITRSLDGIHFASIGNVRAVGNSNQLSHYSYLDLNAMNDDTKHIYYRLEMVDVDGSKGYSDIICVMPSTSPTIYSIYPQPMTDVVTVHLNIEEPSLVTVILVDMSGKQAVVASQEMVKGMQQLTIPTNHLASGMYLMKVIYNGRSETMKLIK